MLNTYTLVNSVCKNAIQMFSICFVVKHIMFDIIEIKNYITMPIEHSTINHILAKHINNFGC
jgi:hypothetical protein